MLRRIFAGEKHRISTECNLLNLLLPKAKCGESTESLERKCRIKAKTSVDVVFKFVNVIVCEWCLFVLKYGKFSEKAYHFYFFIFFFLLLLESAELVQCAHLAPL